MADLERVIQVVFNGVDRVSDTTRQISSNLSTLSNRVEGIAQPFASLTDGILKVDAALAALALGLGGVAFAKAVDFESAVADLKKQLDETDPPIEQLTRSIKDLALEFGISSAQLVQSTAGFKQAGFDASESLSLLEQSIRLVLAGEVEAGEASEILIAALKGFKAPASEAAHLIEVLNAGSNAYATNVTELGTGMSKLSPIAAQMGLSFEDTADILIPVIEVFRSGSEASDALKTGLLSLLKPTGEAAKVLKQMGVEVEDQNGKLRSGRDIVFDFAEAFVKLEGSQQAQVAATVFGKDQAARLIEAFNGLGNKTVDVAEAMKRVASVQDEVNNALDKTKTIINRTKVAFDELAITVGSKYKDELAGIIDATGEFARAMDKAIETGAFDEFFNALKPKLKAIENVIREMAKNLPKALEGVDFSNVVAAFESLGIEIGGVFSGLFGEIDLSTVEGLTKALQKTADGFAALINVTAGIARSFQPVFAAIGEAITNFSELGARAQFDLGLVLGVAKQIVDFGAGIAAVFLTIGQAGIQMARVMDGVFGGIKFAINALQVSFDTLAFAIVRSVFDIANIANTVSFGKIPGLDEAVDNLWRLKEAIKENLVRNAYEAREGMDALGGAFDANNPKYAEAEARLKRLSEQLNQTTQATQDTTRPTRDLNAEMLALADAGVRVEKVIDPLTGKIKLITSAAEQAAPPTGKLATAISQSAQAAQEAIDKARGYKLEIIDGIPTYTQVGNIWKQNADTQSEAAKRTEEATQEAEKFRLKMEEIASNERIKTIEAAVSLNIAELEADTQRVESAFKSIDTTIESTGNLLGTLFEQFPGLDDMFPDQKLRQIEDQIERENKLRKQAADDQHRLVEEQIKALQARTRALNKGDALIKVSAEGLEPHLEAIWFEVLKAIQVRANQDGLEMLVGL